MAQSPTLSIVVPVRNSAHNLELFLRSLEASTVKDFEVIVNDDPISDDNTKDVVETFADKMALTYVVDNPSMAAGRRNGAFRATGDVLLHLDSDMRVSPGLVGECIDRIATGDDALVIPEVSTGENFWARARGLEKRMYDGVESIEGLRCVKRSIYQQVDGHNPQLVFAEDKDFDLRVRAVGAMVGRTENHLIHDEGRPTLRTIFGKKRRYLATAAMFAAEHPEQFADQTSATARLKVLLSKWRLALRDPVEFLGILIIGATELSALLLAKRSTKSSATSRPVASSDR